MPEEIRKQYDEMIAWINSSLITKGLLYDLDLLPEQLEMGSRRWIEMVTIVAHMKQAYDEGFQNCKSDKI